MKNISIILASLAIALLVVPAITEAGSTQACTLQYQPVCGMTMSGEYHTFGNSCTLAAERAAYQHEGECTAAELGSAPAEASGEYAPPANCVAWNDGCNSCSRRGTGGATLCTMMACMGTPRAGYCTAYDNTGTKDTVPATVPASKPLPPASIGVTGDTTVIESGAPVAVAEATVAATTTETRPPLLIRIWTSIATWFSNLF